MHAFARLLQVVGLTLPPVSMILQLMGNLSASKMLVMLVFSVCVFYVGRMLEGYARG